MAVKKVETKTKKVAATPAKKVVKKAVKTPAAKPAAAAKKAAPAPAVKKTAEKPRLAGNGFAAPRKQEVIPLEPKPNARACPLVLDGIITVEDFSPRKCLSCDEFDCRFYAVEEKSRALGSRMFAADDGGDDGFGDDDNEGFGGFYEDNAGEEEEDDYDE